MSDRWPALLTKAEAAEYLGIGQRTIERLMSAKTIKPVVIGRSVRLRRSHLDAYIDKLPSGQTAEQRNSRKPKVGVGKPCG